MFSRQQYKQQLIQPLHYKDIIINYNRIIKGFKNPRNRCYQNSLFQALFNIPTFQYFLNNYPIEIKNDTNLLFLIKNLFLSLYKDTTENYNFINDEFINLLFETKEFYIKYKNLIKFKDYILQKDKNLKEEYINKYLDFLKKIIYSNFSNTFKKNILILFYSHKEEYLQYIIDEINKNELTINEYFDKQLKNFYDDINNLDYYKSIGIKRNIYDCIYEYFNFLKKEKFKKYIDIIKNILLSKKITYNVKKNILILLYNGGKIDKLTDEQYNLSFQYYKEQQRFTKSIFEEELEQKINKNLEFNFKSKPLKDLTEYCYDKINEYYKKNIDLGIDFSNYSIQQDSFEFFIYLYINIEKYLKPLEENIENINTKLNRMCKNKKNIEQNFIFDICNELKTKFEYLTNFNEINRLFKIFFIKELIPIKQEKLQFSKEFYIKYNIDLTDTLNLSINKYKYNDDLINLINLYMNNPLNIVEDVHFDIQPENIKRNSNEKNQFIYLPNILCIILKRFEYDLSTYSSIKLINNINIPLELDLERFFHPFFKNLNTKTKYILCSAILHLGKSKDSGHYITINRDMNNLDDFYLYNDETVEKLTSYNQNISDYANINNSAYILFYMKV